MITIRNNISLYRSIDENIIHTYYYFQFMALSDESLDKVHDKIYIDWVGALLIRDFWKAKTETLTFVFDTNIDKDLWLSSKAHKFNELVKEWVLLEWPTHHAYHRVGILNIWKSTIDEYYETLLYKEAHTEYKNSIQDDITRTIIAELYPVFGTKITINLFEFVMTPEKKEEYFLYCNPLISLLRLEYENKIAIDWLGSFCIDERVDRYFAECTITIQEDKNNTHNKEVWVEEEAIFKIVKDARNNNNEVHIGKEKDGSLLIKTIIHYDNSVRMVELQNKYPYAHIETVTHKWKIQGYTITTKEKLTKQ